MLPNAVKPFQEDSEILNNQIRSFTIALIKFFIQNKTCEWATIHKELDSMNGSIQKVLNSFRTTRDRSFERSFERSSLEVEQQNTAPNVIATSAYQTFFEEVEESLQANEDHEETLDESSTESNSIEVENKTQNSSVKSQADIVNAIEALKSAFEPREFDEIQGYFNF
jgi:hypothetical protein